jgi:hypothetical protein
MPSWEKESAIAVYEQIKQLVMLTGGKSQKLTQEQKGRFVCLCWIAQIYKYIPEPKPAYVADWEQLPEWQRCTDIAIFEAIERQVVEESMLV